MTEEDTIDKPYRVIKLEPNTLIDTNLNKKLIVNKKTYIQNKHLRILQEKKLTISIFLRNGIQLVGHVEFFDLYTILIRNPDLSIQLVYKHAITSILLH
jgi:host factor-I protein